MRRSLYAAFLMTMMACGDASESPGGDANLGGNGGKAGGASHAGGGGSEAQGGAAGTDAPGRDASAASGAAGSGGASNDGAAGDRLDATVTTDATITSDAGAYADGSDGDASPSPSSDSSTLDGADVLGSIDAADGGIMSDAATAPDAQVATDSSIGLDASSDGASTAEGSSNPVDAGTDGGATCKPSSSSGTHWVDPINGKDDSNHGAGPGACALQTITFALTRATSRIEVRGDPNATTGETFPLVLSGKQEVACSSSGADRVTGIGAIGPWFATIAFTGTANALLNCRVRTLTNPSPSAGVYVQTDGTHVISKIDASGYSSGAGVLVEVGVNRTDIATSRFTANGYGVFFRSIVNMEAVVGSVTNCVFASNTTNDIRCFATSGNSAVAGSGNLNGLSAPTCANCSGCPFN